MLREGNRRATRSVNALPRRSRKRTGDHERVSLGGASPTSPAWAPPSAGPGWPPGAGRSSMGASRAPPGADARVVSQGCLSRHCSSASGGNPPFAIGAHPGALALATSCGDACLGWRGPSGTGAAIPNPCLPAGSPYGSRGIFSGHGSTNASWLEWVAAKVSSEAGFAGAWNLRKLTSRGRVGGGALPRFPAASHSLLLAPKSPGAAAAGLSCTWVPSCCPLSRTQTPSGRSMPGGIQSQTMPSGSRH